MNNSVSTFPVERRVELELSRSLPGDDSSPSILEASKHRSRHNPNLFGPIYLSSRIFRSLAMAIISATTLLRTLSVSHITVAYYLLTSPLTITDQNLVYILGAAMDIVCSQRFRISNKPFLEAVNAERKAINTYAPRAYH